VDGDVEGAVCADIRSSLDLCTIKIPECCSDTSIQVFYLLWAATATTQKTLCMNVSKFPRANENNHTTELNYHSYYAEMKGEDDI